MSCGSILLSGSIIWASLALTATTAPAQVPEPITVQGVLEDSLGRPLSGSRSWRLRFFTDATGTTQIGSNLTGTTTLGEKGRFSFQLVPPASALSAVDLHYDLAIDGDTPPNGIDAGDLFPGLVRVTSVPFARVAGDSPRLGGVAASSYALKTELPNESYAVIVDDDGPADFNNLRDAIISGARTVFVRNGNYTLNSIVDIPSAPFALIGESKAGVRINCNNIGVIRYAGSSGLPYRVGTASVLPGSNSVASASGSPQWISNAFAGDVIRIAGSFHEIASVVSNTQISLRRSYQGPQLLNANYSIAFLGQGFHFEGLTFINARDGGQLGQQDATLGAICLRFARDIMIRDCALEDNDEASGGPMTYLENCLNATIRECHTIGGGLIHAASTSNLTIAENTSLNSWSFTAGPISILLAADDEPMFGLEISSNRIIGARGGINRAAVWVGYSGAVANAPIPGDFRINNNYLSYCSGIDATDPGQGSNSGIIGLSNVRVGIGLISGNMVRACFGNALLISGTGSSGMSITGNHFTGNNGWPIRSSGSGHADMIIANNIMTGNAQSGLNVTGAYYGTMNVPKYEVPLP